MSLTEQTRVRLHRFIEEHMGEEIAREVLDWLPRGELATKDDLEAVRLATKADIEGLRTEVKADIHDLRTELKTDIHDLRTEVKADIEGLRTEVKTDIHDLRTEVKADIHDLRTDLNAHCVATKVDFDHLREVMDLRFSKTATAEALAEFRAEFHRTLRTHTLVLVGVVGALVSLAKAF